MVTSDSEIGEDFLLLRDAAQIFQDFGDFSHLHRSYDLEQVRRAKSILKKINEKYYDEF